MERRRRFAQLWVVLERPNYRYDLLVLDLKTAEDPLIPTPDTHWRAA